MSDLQMNRRQALIATGLGTLSLGMPGVVMGSDKLDAQGNVGAADLISMIKIVAPRMATYRCRPATTDPSSRRWASRHRFWES